MSGIKQWIEASMAVEIFPIRLRARFRELPAKLKIMKSYSPAH